MQTCDSILCEQNIFRQELAQIFPTSLMQRIFFSKLKQKNVRSVFWENISVKTFYSGKKIAILAHFVKRCVQKQPLPAEQFLQPYLPVNNFFTVMNTFSEKSIKLYAFLWKL